MRVLIGALVLSGCAWSTHVRSQDWRSDRALWFSARQTAPGLARPALNLGIALIGARQWEEATTELLAAVQLYSPQPADTRWRAGAGLGLVHVLGLPVCDRPTVSPWCVWR